jgi:hypothetical protein
MDEDGIPDGIAIDTQRLESPLATARRQADEAYALWSEIWAERERTARFYGQNFEPEWVPGGAHGWQQAAALHLLGRCDTRGHVMAVRLVRGRGRS